MTMPHLMNCAHQADGWCLACVGEQHAKIERLRDELDLHRKYQERAAPVQPLTRKELERIAYQRTRLNPNQADDRELLRYVVAAMQAAIAASGAKL